MGLLGGSCLCCAICIATTRRLANLRIYQRAAHMAATGKHVLQPKASGGDFCFFSSALAALFFFLKKSFRINHTGVNGVSFLLQLGSLAVWPWGRKVMEANSAYLLICPLEGDALCSGADTPHEHCREFDNRRRGVSVKRNNCSSRWNELKEIKSK